MKKYKRLDVSVRDGTFLETIERTLHINTEEEFLDWTQNDLQSIFPHGKLVCGIGRFKFDHGVFFGTHTEFVTGHNFPKSYLQSLIDGNGITASPIINRWLQIQKPVLYEPDVQREGDPAHPEWRQRFIAAGLINLAAHGQCDIASMTGTYFSFSCIPGQLGEQHTFLMNLIIPHMHLALRRVADHARSCFKSVNLPKLTARESSILELLSRGFSNSSIAERAQLSESTVKNHVHNLMGKLRVSSRAKAVVAAKDMRLLKF